MLKEVVNKLTKFNSKVAFLYLKLWTGRYMPVNCSLPNSSLKHFSL